MATRPMSAWDNFSESYMKAREARAMEERRKEMSMREFDDNQRAWNQEQRTDDLYQSYTKPFNAYGLDNAGMTNELTAKKQAGNLAEAGMLSDLRIRTSSNPEYVNNQEKALLGVAGYDAMKKTAWQGLSPQDQASFFQGPYYTGAYNGLVDKTNLSSFDPKQVILDERAYAALGRAQNAKMAYEMLRDISAKIDEDGKKTAQSKADSETSVIPKGSRPALNKDALLSTPAAPTASAPASTPVAQSPMAAMVAKPSTAETNYTQALEAKKAIEQKMRFMISTGRQDTEEYRNLADNLAKAQSVIDLAKFKIPNNSNK